MSVYVKYNDTKKQKSGADTLLYICYKDSKTILFFLTVYKLIVLYSIEMFGKIAKHILHFLKK